MYLPKTPLLTAQQEADLSRTVEAGLLAAEALAGRGSLARDATGMELETLVELGRRAEDAFVTANLRLVRLIALRVALRSSLPVDDLFQEGCVALTEAVRRYDPDRRVRFASFAYPWIHSRMAASVAEHQTIRRPRQSRSPVPALIRLDEVELPGTEDTRLEDLERDRVDLSGMLAELDDRCRQIVTMRFGVGGQQPCTLHDIAHQLGISITTVRREEERSLAVLRRRLARAGIMSSGAAWLVPLRPAPTAA